MLIEFYIEAPRAPHMDEDFLDMIDQAFLEGQIDGETMELVYLWLSAAGSARILNSRHPGS